MAGYGFDLPQFPVWLATFSDHKRKNHYIGEQGQRKDQYVWVNAEAEGTPDIHRSLALYESKNELLTGTVSQSIFPVGHEIVGLLLLEPYAQHHALLQLNEEMQAQYHFWSSLAEDGLEGRLYYFRVVKADMMRVRMSLKGTAVGRNACFVGLDSTWVDRCYTKDAIGVSQHDFDTWRRLSNGKAPVLALRLPKAIAFLLVSRSWTFAAVPESLLAVNILAGWEIKTNRCCPGNKLLAMRDSFQQLLPPAMKYNPSLASSDFAAPHVLQALQSAGMMLQASSIDAESRQLILFNMYSAAVALQEEDVRNRVFMQKNSSIMKARKYSAVKLLEFFWVAGLLQTGKNLRLALKHACEACLPPDAKQAAVSFLEGLGEQDSLRLRVPSPATLSRVRARLDVAWTLLFRKWVMSHLQECGGQGISLFVQTDATWQARQEYQIAVLNCVPKIVQLELHKDRLHYCPCISHVLWPAMSFVSVGVASFACGGVDPKLPVDP